ncbi:MAG: hypothetical protein ACJA01_004291, partial [Saprospiraceae bacterium]
PVRELVDINTKKIRIPIQVRFIFSNYETQSKKIWGNLDLSIN